jgi:CRISPR-associated protein Cmr3
MAFTPRDTVFVRDGRSFNAAADRFGQSVQPGPTTIAGAVGAALRAEPAEVRGPILARRAGDAWEPYFRVPADLVETASGRGRVYRLEPCEPGDAVTDGPAGMRRWMVPLEHAEPVEPVTGWMPGPVLARYLAGSLPGSGGAAMSTLGIPLEDPLPAERRVGLAREGRQARDGFLYQSVHLRPRDGWAFLAECAGDKQLAVARSNVQFGGKARLADVDLADVSWPELPAEIGARVLVYLATPAIWPGGWRIPVPEGAELVAAVAGKPEPAATVTPGAGWKDSRALRWAVPAGSVYLLEFGSAAAGQAWAARWHGSAYGRDDRDRLRTAGFGVVLTGVWT